MALTVEAIYQNGMLKLVEPLPFKETEKVQITIYPDLTWAERNYGIMRWTGDAETLRRIAEDPEFGILESP